MSGKERERERGGNVTTLMSTAHSISYFIDVIHIQC